MRDSSVNFDALTYSNAKSMRPPLHPSLPNPVEQSINYYSENDKSVLDSERKLAPSHDPVVEKDQHDPHYP